MSVLKTSLMAIAAASLFACSSDGTDPAKDETTSIPVTITVTAYEGIDAVTVLINQDVHSLTKQGEEGLPPYIFNSPTILLDKGESGTQVYNYKAIAYNQGVIEGESLQSTIVASGDDPITVNTVIPEGEAPIVLGITGPDTAVQGKTITVKAIFDPKNPPIFDWKSPDCPEPEGIFGTPTAETTSFVTNLVKTCTLIPHVNSLIDHTVVYTEKQNRAPKVLNVSSNKGESFDVDVTTTLTAIGFDFEETPLTYKWSYDFTPADPNAPVLAATLDTETSNPTKFTAKSAGVYAVKVYANDGNQDSLPFTINLTANALNVDTPAKITKVEVPLNAFTNKLLSFSVSAKDDDVDDILVYSWSDYVQGDPLTPCGGFDYAGAAANNATLAEPKWMLTEAKLCTIAVSVSSNGVPALPVPGTIEKPIAVTVEVPDAPPVIDSASANPATLTLNDLLTGTTAVTALGSDVDPGQVVTYTWGTQPDSGAACAGSSFGDAVAQNTTWTPTVAGDCILTVTPRSNNINGAAFPVPVTVLSEPPPTPPVVTDVKAEPDEVTVGQKTTLTVVATDPELEPVTFEWSAAANCVGAFSVANPVDTPTVDYTVDEAAPAGTCVLSVVASAGGDSAVAETITITIHPSQAAPLSVFDMDFDGSTEVTLSPGAVIATGGQSANALYIDPGVPAYAQADDTFLASTFTTEVYLKDQPWGGPISYAERDNGDLVWSIEVEYDAVADNYTVVAKVKTTARVLVAKTAPIAELGLNDWTHVAVAYSANTSLRIYVDGVEKARTNPNGLLAGSGNIRHCVGVNYDPATQTPLVADGDCLGADLGLTEASPSLAGSFDEITVWDRFLRADQICARAGKVWSYKLDECQ